MITNVDDAFNTARAILDSVVSIYQEYDGVTPLPSRQYIAVGGPATQPHDCEQVTVSLDQIYVGPPGQPVQGPVRCDSPRTGVYSIEIVRKTVTQTPTYRNGRVAEIKTAESETAFAKTQMQDQMLLLEAGMRVGDESLAGAIADVSSGPESGGYQAMTMTLIISL